MPRYAIIGDHSPLSCPGASKSAAEFAERTIGTKLPEVAQRLGVTLDVPLHLDPSPS